MNTPMSLRQVFNQLAAEGVVLPEHTVYSVVSAPAAPAAPWYVRVFAGLGAWTAASLLLSFLSIIGLMSSHSLMLGLGLLLSAGTCVLSRQRAASDFMQQLGFSISLVSQIMVVSALDSLLGEVVVVALAVIALELVLIWAYNDHLHRVLSSLWIIGALLIVFFDLNQFNLVHVLIVALAGLITLISVYEVEWLLSRWWELASAVRYGAALGLMVLLALESVSQNELLPIYGWWLSGSALLALLALAGLQIARDLRLSLSRSLAAVVVVFGLGLALMSLKMPGIAGATLLLTLGFWRSNRMLLGLAAIALVLYLISYYYSLELTLLTKSMILAASGGLLLSLRLVLARINQEGVR